MNKKKIINLYVICLGLLGVLASSLRSYALITSFDAVTMHFTGGVAFPISAILVTIGIIAFAIYPVFDKNNEDMIPKTQIATSFAPAGMVSIALFFFGFSCFESVDKYTPKILFWLSIIGGIFAFISVAYIFLSIFIEKRISSFKGLISLSIVVFLTVYACFLYFNKQTHPTNSPNKIIDQLTFLLSAIFFLFESRIPLGRAKWRPYVSFGLIAALMCYYSSIPALAYYIGEKRLISNSLIESIFLLTLAIYITTKVLQTKNLIPDSECEVAKSIAALASIRQEEIEEARKLSHAHDIINEEKKDDVQDASNYTFDIPYVDTAPNFNSQNADSDLNQRRSE